MQTQLREEHETEMARLLRQLDDEDGIKRRHARARLAAKGRRATERLVILLASHRKRLRWEAAKVLADIADPASVPPLITALEDREWSVRWVAAEALARIGRPALLPLLELLKERPDELDVRDGVHHVFHDLWDPDARDMIAPVYHELSRCGSNLDLFMAVQQVEKRLGQASTASGSLPATEE